MTNRVSGSHRVAVAQSRERVASISARNATGFRLRYCASRTACCAGRRAPDSRRRWYGVRATSKCLRTVHRGSDARFGHQATYWLEEVDVQPHLGIQVPEEHERPLGAVAVVADEAAHHVAVLLLDPRLVILLVGSSAGEADALLVAVRDEQPVQKLCPVVGVQLSERDGQASPGFVDRRGDALRAGPPVPHTGWNSLQPVATSTATNVARYKPAVVSPQCSTRSAWSAPGTWHHPRPLAEGAYRDLCLERSRSGTTGPERLTLSASHSPPRAQEPVDRRRARREQQTSHVGCEQ